MKFLILFFLFPLLVIPMAFSGPSLSGIELYSSQKFSWDLEKAKKGTVLFFLSSSCPCSNSHLPHLEDLKKEFSQFSFIGVHSHRSATKEKTQQYFGKKKLSFPILFDSNLKIANLYKAVKTPHVFILGKKGEILFHGGITNSVSFKAAKKFYLKNALLDIQKGKRPQKSFARALGCYISR